MIRGTSTTAAEAPAAPTPTPAERRRDLLWQGAALTLWAALPCISLQISQITLFDMFILLVLMFIGLSVANPLRPRKRGAGLFDGTRWRLKGPVSLYGALIVLILAGAMSGMNARHLGLWGFELLTFIYLLVMTVTLDLFSSHQIRRFLRIGAWVFVPICLITGLGALLSALGVVRVTWFYQQLRGTVGAGDKFRGLAYTPNQWAILIAAMFPFLLMLLTEKGKARLWLKGALLVAIVLSVFMAPATGSRSGLAILAVEALMFFGLYLGLDRTISPTRRAVMFGTGLVTAVAAWLMLNSILTDSWVFRRSLGGVGDLAEAGSVADDWRSANWGWALAEYADHPVLGIGFGNFELLYDQHEVHSTYLSLLAEAGPIAMLAYTALFVVALWRLTKLLLAGSVLRQPNLMAIALITCLSSQAVLSVFHNLTRNRHLALLLLVGALYAEQELRRLQAEARQEQAQRLQRAMPPRARR